MPHLLPNAKNDMGLALKKYVTETFDPLLFLVGVPKTLDSLHGTMLAIISNDPPSSLVPIGSRPPKEGSEVACNLEGLFHNLLDSDAEVGLEATLQQPPLEEGEILDKVDEPSSSHLSSLFDKDVSSTWSSPHKLEFQ